MPRVLKINDVIMFIIPNRIGCINDNLVVSARAKEENFFNEIFKLNGIDRTIDPASDRLVQLWFASKSLGTDNLVCHGGEYIVHGENGVEHIRIHPGIETLPACLFEGICEGEKMNLKVPDGDNILDMTVMAAQLNYRYGEYGRFEEVLEYTSGIPSRVAIVDHVLKFKADGFIVPNHADRIVDNEHWKNNSPQLIAYLDEVCKLNGYYGLNLERDRIVDVWLSSKDQLKSENLSDHGATISTEDGKATYHINLYYLHLIPEKILYGRCEGEIFTFKAPFNPDYPHYPATGDVMIKMELRLAQKEYRYKRFGNFENVLDMVCGR